MTSALSHCHDPAPSKLQKAQKHKRSIFDPEALFNKRARAGNLTVMGF
jgi:hypothetical protein